MASRNPILVIEVLKEFITGEEGKTTVFDCKLNQPDIIGNWYKNGIPLIPDDRMIMSVEGRWQMLEINFVTKDDEGIYCFAAKSNSYEVYTKCMFSVKPQAHDNLIRYLRDPLAENIRVAVNLRNYNVKEGERVTLRAEFTTRIKNCTWYKNNCELPARYPKCLLENEAYTITRLYIDLPERTDSGIYSIIAQTYDGKYLCSYADVLIGNDYIRGLYNNETIPHIWAGPGDIIKVYEMDTVRILFKVSFDTYTIIEWTKDGTEVKFNDRIKCETYCNRYIALTLRGVTIADNGTYYLILRHRLSTDTEVTSTRIIVKKHTEDTLPSAPCTVKRRLMPTMASVGNAATLRASFKIPVPKLNYVVWTLGHYNILKSNSKFEVMCDGDEFILYIPVVTPEMTGEVCCQLRQHLPSDESILLCKTTSYLAVLPPQVIEEANNTRRVVKEINIFSGTFVKITLPRGIIRRPWNVDRGRSANSADVILYVQFCRMRAGNFFFEALNEEYNCETTSVGIEKLPTADRNAAFPTPGNWRVNWIRPNSRSWYAYDFCLPSGEYRQIGLSNSSTLDIKEPPEDKLFKFRVRAVKAQNKRDSSHFCYTPAELATGGPADVKNMSTFKDFKKSYKNTDEILDNGTFGIVTLVKSQNGQTRIAKFVKNTNNSIYWDPTREFDILRTVFHPNTIRINEGYNIKKYNGYILTMEYLWGGELNNVIIDREDMTEDDAIVYIRQVLLALEYLHAKNIAHLDIQPDNIMCINRNSRMIKLLDFGMARVLEQPSTLSLVYRSRDFVPPEMLMKELVGTPCDMWSLGVLTYWLLTETMPFIGANWIEQCKNIIKASYSYEDIHFRVISDRAKEFICYLLRAKPDDRLTAVMALNNCWITDGPDEGRPQKVLMPSRGGMILVTEAEKVEKLWKSILFLVLAIVRFRAKRNRDPYHGRRRYSLRLYARRKYMKHTKQI